MQLILSLVRVIHVIGAVIWAGWVFSNVAFLAPAVQASGQAGGAAMGQSTQDIAASSYGDCAASGCP